MYQSSRKQYTVNDLILGCQCRVGEKRRANYRTRMVSEDRASMNHTRVYTSGGYLEIISCLLKDNRFDVCLSLRLPDSQFACLPVSASLWVCLKGMEGHLLKHMLLLRIRDSHPKKVHVPGFYVPGDFMYLSQD